jgi:hypothetical protein
MSGTSEVSSLVESPCTPCRSTYHVSLYMECRCGLRLRRRRHRNPTIAFVPSLIQGVRSRRWNSTCPTESMPIMTSRTIRNRGRPCGEPSHVRGIEENRIHVQTLRGAAQVCQCSTCNTPETSVSRNRTALFDSSPAILSQIDG